MSFLYIYPPQQIAASPLQYTLNGVTQLVIQDTVTPGNSKPLPVVQLDGSGNVSTPLTDAQLRATPVPVSGPLTDAQLRASAVPVSLAASPLPTGAATAANQSTEIASLSSIDTKLTSQATAANQSTLITNTTDIPNVITTEGGAQSSKGVMVMGHTGVGVARHILVGNTGIIQTAVTSSALPTGAATAANQATEIASLSSIDTKLTSQATAANQTTTNTRIGDLTETAPASDTASSGLNGRLQRIAQRLTSLIALFPATIGQKANATSLGVSLSTEQEALLTAIRDGARASVPNGSSQSNSTVSTTAINVSIPANTVGFLIQGFTGNAGLYWSLGGTAANDGTSGHKLEDSRDSGFIPYAGAGNLSVIGEAASTRYQITWFTRS